MLCFEEEVMDYEKAREVMVKVDSDGGDHVCLDDVGEALLCAIRALNHCVELGLDGNDALDGTFV